MAETLSLMEFLQALLADAELRGAFGHDPQGTLAAHGLADLTPADVHDALVLVQDNQTVDYSLDPAAAPPPPPPAGDGHEAAVEYLARYLADPHAAPDEHWADLDPDVAVAPARFVPDDAPVAAFGIGDDHGYGAGAGPSADPGWGGGEYADPGSYDPGSYDPGSYDPGSYDLGSDDLGGLDGLGGGEVDHGHDHGLDDLDAADGDWPDAPGSAPPDA